MSFRTLRLLLLFHWDGIVWYFFFFSPFFRRNVRFPPKKIFSLATPGAIVFHIRSNYGIWADNRDLVNQSERKKCIIRGWEFNNVFYLTNRFHFAVRLYSDNAQMTSKRGENKEVRYEPQASSVTDVLTTFWRPLCVIRVQTHGKMESICFIQ